MSEQKKRTYQQAFVVCRSAHAGINGGLNELNDALRKGWRVKSVHPMSSVGSGDFVSFANLVIVESEPAEK